MRLDRAAVGVVVLSLFFERLDRNLYLGRGFPIPDISFDVAVAVLSARYLLELVRGRARLARATTRELVAGGFVLLIFLLGIAALLVLPSWLVSGSQIVKTCVHLGFLAYAAVLLGRVLTRELLLFALKLYFWVASAAAGLAIVQAVDLNAGNGFLTRHLHLLYRVRSSGYKAPVSFFSEPSHLGYASVAALVVALLLGRSIGIRRAVAGGALCALALLLSLAAGPMLVAGVLAVILLFRHRRLIRVSTRGWTAVGALGLVVVAVAAATPVGPAIYHRANGIVNGSDPSGRWRSAVDRGVIREWKLAPATGVGAGNSRSYLPSLVQLPFRSGGVALNDSNGYLSMLGEAGPLGLAGLIVLLTALIWPASRRPNGLALATELNTLGVAVSLVVTGALILPPLWFWGGMAMAAARISEQPELLDTTVGRMRRLLGRGRPGGPPPSPMIRGLKLALLVLVIAAAGGLGYAAGYQRSSAPSLRFVKINGVKRLSRAPEPGDVALAHVDKQLWGQRFCGRHCHAKVRYLAGRIWEIHAYWRHGGQWCLLLDLAHFGQAGASSGGLTSSFTGLTSVPCTSQPPSASSHRSRPKRAPAGRHAPRSHR